MRKRRVPKNAIVLKGLVFKLGIRTIIGRVVEQNGAVCFASDTESLYCLLPFRVSESNYGQDIEAWVRTYDKSLVFKLGPDDLLLERLDDDKRFFDVVSLEPMEELFERGLLRAMPKFLSAIRYAAWSLLLTAILVVFKVRLFPFVVVPGSIAVYCAAWALRQYHYLNKRVLYDAVGNWIDLSSGVTSLNGGDFQFDIKEM